MSAVRLYGATSGYVELTPPAVAGSTSLELPLDSLQPGMVHLHTETFSAKSSVSMDNVFSSDYEFYTINLSFITSSNVDLRYQWRDSSGNLTQSLYDSHVAVLVAAYEQDRTGNASYGKLVRNTGAFTHTLSMELSGLTANGQANQSPTLVGNSFRTNSMFSFGSTYKSAGSVTGLHIFPNGGTWSGTISVYGKRNN